MTAVGGLARRVALDWARAWDDAETALRLTGAIWRFTVGNACAKLYLLYPHNHRGPRLANLFRYDGLIQGRLGVEQHRAQIGQCCV